MPTHQATEERFSRVVEYSPSAMLMVNSAGSIEMVNMAAEKLFGYDRSELIGKSIDILVPESFRHQHPDHRAHFLAAPQPRAMGIGRELHALHKNGSQFPVEIGLNPIETATGIVVLAAIIDISARKRSDERFRSVVEHAPNAMLMVSATGLIEMVNAEAVRLFGYEREEMIGQPIEILVPERFRHHHPAQRGSFFADPKSRSMGVGRDLYALRKDGGEFPVEIGLNPIETGETVAVLAAIIDISERKRLEEQVEARNRAEEANRLQSDFLAKLEMAHSELVNAKEEAEQATQAKSTFLSNMSHELRTPLNAILGFAQLLETEADRATADQKADFVQHIIKAGKHLLTLINEILDLAKIEAGKVTLSPEAVGLFDILSECRIMLEPLAAQREIRMIFPPQSGLHVRADRTRLKQILLNLFSNAIKYNRDKGAVVIDCAIAAPDRIRISIQDTGLGLSPDQLQQLFQPFCRLGQETGQQEGTGIGLVVTKRLVEMMEGAIGVSSTVGIGSIFWVELPAKEPDATPLDDVPPPPARSPQQKKALLLYVEDNPANLKLVEEIIHFRGDLDMISAPDGYLGVQLARAHQPALILMDIHLPGMSGSEAQMILKADPATRHIPVIALTANAMPREVEKGLAAGFFRYITKPIDITELTNAIDNALETVPPEGGPI